MQVRCQLRILALCLAAATQLWSGWSVVVQARHNSAVVVLTESRCAFPTVEWVALQSLYNSTKGSDWRWNSTQGAQWDFSNSSTNPCEDNWAGVRCVYETPPLSSSQYCNVSSLRLSKMGLVGTLPESMSWLVSLQHLDLNINRLFGGIPDALTTYGNLTALMLRGNHWFGTIPESIGNLLTLEVLDIGEGNLQGSIPDSICQLYNLQVLNLTQNNLTSSLPSCLGDLVHLEHLDVGINLLNNYLPRTIGLLTELISLRVGKNFLSGPVISELSQLMHLEVLDLGNNSFTGTVPVALESLVNLRFFSVGNNYLHGTIPGALIANMKNLTSLSFNSNRFHGYIPSEVASLTLLEELSFSLNGMSGSIPENITLLTNLMNLYLSNNNFTGPIPTNWSAMTPLKILEVYGNKLTGTIPQSLGSLQLLDILDIGGNQLRGSIPEHLCNATMLSAFLANANALTGTLPKCIGNLTHMIDLLLQENNLHGPFPSEYLQLSRLAFLYVYGNRLTGSLPHGFGSDYKHLRQLDMHGNLFTGTLPNTICDMKLMRYFYASTNSFHGHVPDCIGNMTFMIQLLLQENSFSGSIPQTIGNMISLLGLALQTNLFTGTMDNDVFRRLSNVQVVLVENNFLTGALPMQVGDLRRLVLMNVSNNVLSGPLPSSMRNLTLLRTVDVSSNSFSGKSDNLFTSSPNLNVLFLENNRLSGHLDNLFNSSSQRFLTNVDVSDNVLSGSLPAEFFENSEQLISFAAVKNCITGSLPVSLCSGKYLRSISLDGLHTAESCQDQIFAHSNIIHTYTLNKVLSGTIPSCLFEMKSLDTLHLSGNGLQGTIVSDVQLGEYLTDLSLSHNSLTGTIPAAIQSRSFVHLDLSFNKLTGLLNNYSTSHFAESSLALQVNRLSGHIPRTMLNLTDISILQGNIFSCSQSRNTLPQHDSYARSYECGSDSVNVSLFVWISFFVAVCVMGCLLLWTSGILLKGQEYILQSHIKQWWIVFSDPKILFEDERSISATLSLDLASMPSIVGMMGLLNTLWKLLRFSMFSSSGLNMTSKSRTNDGRINFIFRFGLLLSRLRKIIIYIVAVLMFGFLPLYVVLNHFYRIYTHSYGWQLGLAFMSGFVPSVTLCLSFITLSAFIYYLLRLWLLDSYVEEVLVGKRTDSKISKRTQADRRRGRWFSREISKDRAISLEPGNFKADIFQQQQRHDAESMAMPWFFGKQIVIAFINCVTVLTVNMAFVYASTLNIDKKVMDLLVFLITAFKVLWGGVVVVNVFGVWLMRGRGGGRWEAQQLELSAQQEQTLVDSLTASMMRFLVYLSLFNLVVAPALAAMMISPDCFFYMIVNSPAITVSYSFLHCDSYVSTTVIDGCVQFGYATHSTSYDPPYSYSFQCSSAVLTNFVDIFVYRYLFSGIVLPVSLIVVKAWQERCFHRFQENSWNKTIFNILTKLLPVIARPVAGADLENADIDASTNESVVVVPNPMLSTISDPSAKSMSRNTSTMDSFSSILYQTKPVVNPDNNISAVVSSPGGISPVHRSTMAESHYRKTLAVDTMIDNHKERKKLFNKEQFTVSLVGDIAVLMTFGVAYPVLALVIFVVIIVNTFFAQLMIGRFVFLSKTKTQAYLAPLVEFINQECKEVGQLLFVSIPIVSFLATAFWAFALFDTLADRQGVLSGLWVLIIVALMPLWMVCLDYAWSTVRYLYYSYVVDFTLSMAGSLFRASGFSESNTNPSGPSNRTRYDGNGSVTTRTTVGSSSNNESLAKRLRKSMFGTRDTMIDDDGAKDIELRKSVAAPPLSSDDPV